MIEHPGKSYEYNLGFKNGFNGLEPGNILITDDYNKGVKNGDQAYKEYTLGQLLLQKNN